MFLSSGVSLFWAVLMIALMLLLFSLFFVQAVTEYLMESFGKLGETQELEIRSHSVLLKIHWWFCASRSPAATIADWR